LEHHNILFEYKTKSLALPIVAADTAHAQGQALDISRALDCDKYQITYIKSKPTVVSNLFERLALNDFSHNECDLWAGSVTNGSPCFYALSKRYYVRAAILKYLDIPRDGAVPKPRCGNPLCVNPYHFEYHGEKNAKLSAGDIQMLLAFHSQGASAKQIAKALNVNRSTIYRKLKDERIHSGTARHL
jgi:hypothetical protein